MEIQELELSVNEIDELFGIIRPEAANSLLSVNKMNTSQLVEFMNFHSNQCYDNEIFTLGNSLIVFFTPTHYAIHTSLILYIS